MPAAFFAIPVPDGGVCVADYGADRLCLLSADGAAQTLGRSGRGLGEFIRPLGLALTAAGGLLVADGAERVQLLDDEGRAVRAFGTPHDSALAPPPRYAATTTTTTGSSSSSGSSSATWLPHGGVRAVGGGGGEGGGFLPAAADTEKPQPHLLRPCGVATGHDGRVYVSDTGRHRIACFAADGPFAFAFGSRGSGHGELHDPRGLCVHGHVVWVADMCNHRLARFSLRGKPLGAFGRAGSNPGEFTHPVGVGIVHELLVVSEYSGGRLQILSASDGTPLQAVRQPFAGSCLGALGVYARRLVVTDMAGRVHCFDVVRGAPEVGVAVPAVGWPGSSKKGEGGDHDGDGGDDDGGPLALAPARDATAEAAAVASARVSQLRATREGRITLALEATDYRGVLERLSADDVAALMPAARAHAARHPELYSLPPPRSADALVQELDLHLAGRPPPLGPPH